MIATAYDDLYNQTPARLLRTIEGLGYRERILHYVGMSHYFRLEPLGGGHYVSLAGGALNEPCTAWHRAFAGEARARGFEVIWSLSYELFDAHCWNDWKQRAPDGSAARTGWVPPSTLLSPAHSGAMAYLQQVACAFVAIARETGLAVRFQIGEPWWWVMPDTRAPCLYDDAARAAWGGDPPAIVDLRAPLDPAQTELLDRAGALLAQSTAALAQAVREAAGDAGRNPAAGLYSDAARPRHARTPPRQSARRLGLARLRPAPARGLRLADAGRRGAAPVPYWAFVAERLGYPTAATRLPRRLRPRPGRCGALVAADRCRARSRTRSAASPAASSGRCRRSRATDTPACPRERMP